MSVDPFSLCGRRAPVTGASRGLGRVLARGLARASAEVVLNARGRERLEQADACVNGQILYVDGGLTAGL